MHNFTITSQEVLSRISRNCPQALEAYLQCVNRSDEKGFVYFNRKEVEIDMSYSWTKFVNQIKKLSLENLLEWSPLNNGIAITLFEGDDFESM